MLRCLHLHFYFWHILATLLWPFAICCWCFLNYFLFILCILMDFFYMHRIKKVAQKKRTRKYHIKRGLTVIYYIVGGGITRIGNHLQNIRTYSRAKPFFVWLIVALGNNLFARFVHLAAGFSLLIENKAVNFCNDFHFLPFISELSSPLLLCSSVNFPSFFPSLLPLFFPLLYELNSRNLSDVQQAEGMSVTPMTWKNKFMNTLLSFNQLLFRIGRQGVGPKK